MRRQRREKSLNIHISVLVFVHQNYNFHVYTNRITGVEVKMYKVHKATFSWRTQGAVQESSDFRAQKVLVKPPMALCSEGPAVLEACCWWRCNSLCCSLVCLTFFENFMNKRAYRSECFKGSAFFYFRTFPKVSQPSGGKAYIWVMMFLPQLVKFSFPVQQFELNASWEEVALSVFTS